MSATPRPWRISEEDEWCAPHIVDANDDVAISRPVRKKVEAFDIPPETADLIVRAVNAFDALLAVAKAAEGVDDAPTTYERIRSLREALDALDAASPGWREWAP